MTRRCFRAEARARALGNTRLERKKAVERRVYLSLMERLNGVRE